MDAIQGMEKASISGCTFYLFPCTLEESNRNDLVFGTKNKTYSEEVFKQDYKSRNGGFHIKFDECDKATAFN